MGQFLHELAGLPASVTGVLGLCVGALGTILAALITRLIATPFLGARDKQDKEVEWRKHAIELTKLDLDRRLKTRAPADTAPLRPSILDFLANYRDLQELGVTTPKDLYRKILASRISKKAEPGSQEETG